MSTFDPPLDAGIERAVLALRAGGVETCESCEGGWGHAYPEPTVRFHGDRSEGLRALAVALRASLRVTSLRRVWPILDGEPTGPWWEITFVAAEKPTLNCDQPNGENPAVLEPGDVCGRSSRVADARDAVVQAAREWRCASPDDCHAEGALVDAVDALIEAEAQR